MQGGNGLPTTLDCEVLGDLYGTDELRRTFDSRALVQAWLDVERALAEAEADVGVIPEAAAARIAAESDAALYDLAALRAGLAETQHPLVPLIRALSERCGEHGSYVHWGATTQDVIDTGLVLQIRIALRPIRRDLDRAVACAAALARTYDEAPMAGRTHGQHAVPITFGLKAATWADQLSRCVARLRAAEDAAMTAQLGGAAGTLAALGEHGAAVRAAFCRRLDLAEPDLPWHANRDRLRDLGHALDEIAAAGERIAAEIVLLQSTEVAEVAEASGDGHVGSSTMPQKRNPMTSEYIVATARLIRGATRVLVDSAAHAHERDMGAWATEWLAVPQALILTGGLLAKLAAVLEGLEVDRERMLRNLELTRGRVMAEAAMMALAATVGHERAHGHVAAAARRAGDDGTEFAAALLDDPVVAAVLTRDELDRILDPFGYLGLSAEAAAAAATRADAVNRTVAPAT
jgi:adenylosuccinate lyase/3-carboxy-cis,cis-muconate cycloisomerase